MKKSGFHKRIAILLFALTMAAFFVFLIYMCREEQVAVYHLESPHHYSTLTDFESELRSDDTAPAGVVKVYRGTLNPESASEACLCFTISHHNVEVYFDDVLMYRLTAAEGNRIGKNVSANWCAVHVGQAHAGKTVTVVLTPLFEAAISKEPQFLLGSHYAIATDVITGELSLLILTCLCVLLGVFLIGSSVYLRFILKSHNNSNIYLGLFSISIGLWKIADLSTMQMLFAEHTMALGYISVGALFMVGLSLIMYSSTLFEEQKQAVPMLLSSASALVCLYVLAEQLLGITEIRQNLVYSHILLVVAVLSIPLAALFNRIVYKSWGVNRSWRLLLLLFAGIGVDMLLYYRNNGNGLMTFSIISFIVYALIVFLKSVQKATRKAYTDSYTGLENRNRWNELMESTAALPEPFAIMVIDLNGLKQVNDTLGHDAGDRMIYDLSNILRNTLPRSSVICRWGGDEFAVLLTGLNRAKLNRHMDALFTAGETHNADCPELPIHFAVGTALSTEHPGVSHAELFRLADENMYRNKQAWYTAKNSVGN